MNYLLILAFTPFALGILAFLIIYLIHRRQMISEVSVVLNGNSKSNLTNLEIEYGPVITLSVLILCIATIISTLIVRSDNTSLRKHEQIMSGKYVTESESDFKLKMIKRIQQNE